MTSAERPTQEVAPRTEAGCPDPHCLLRDPKHLGPHRVPYMNLDDPGIYRCSFEGCTYRMWDAAHGDVEDHWRSHIEASRSAPLAAVTAEQLAEILKAEGFVRGMAHRYGTFNDAYWEQSAARILSKITPAQPSASSEGDRDPDTDMPWTPEPDPWGKS